MRRESHTTILSLLSCLNHLSSAPSTPLCSGCQNYFIFNPFYSNPLIILVVFQDHLNCRIYKTKFPVHIQFLFPFSVCCVTLTYLSTLNTFLLFMTVAVLCYRSPVNCRERNVEGSFTHRMNCCY